MAPKSCILLGVFVLFTCYYQNVEGNECFNIYGDNLETTMLPGGFATNCPNIVGTVYNFVNMYHPDDFMNCCYNSELKPYCCTNKDVLANRASWIAAVIFMFCLVGVIVKCLCCPSIRRYPY